MLTAELVDGVGELKPTLSKIRPLRRLECGTAELGEHVEDEVEAGVRGYVPLVGFAGRARGNGAPSFYGGGSVDEYAVNNDMVNNFRWKMSLLPRAF